MKLGEHFMLDEAEETGAVLQINGDIVLTVKGEELLHLSALAVSALLHELGRARE